jgi:diguanylate cyclase
LLDKVEVTSAQHEARRWREQSENIAKREQQAQQQACQDGLTGLLNRRAFDDDVQILLNQRDVRPNSISALVIIDIDHFKRINDSYGHTAGDRVLKLLSDLLQASLRSNDRPYRYGGEEFVVLCTLDQGAGLFEFCERLRNAIAKFDFSFQPFTALERITTSIGATILKQSDTVE